MIVYLDTSAAFKLLATEPESDALAEALTALDAADVLLSSRLLFTELHCAAQRRSVWDVAEVNAVLDMVSLVDLTREDLNRAATSGWGLRSEDALHLATALRLEADVIGAYDQELCSAAESAGLHVLRPGTSA
ncbi:type II toxin-antitoxin system VapC family toxin [Janibacter anophelis]|uniref:type II toxin-antitoxin system VapC family toxin n=1 Tax=Janibacter anophelis TaxID=319054 RepID=UPI00082E53A6|nr:type II toxin-antitoxin system VapC family toxin [Janibacter anophelis]